MSDYTEKFSSLSDADWLIKLKSSVHDRTVDGVLLPGFPDISIQSRWVGSANENALDEAYRFYVNVKSSCKALGMPLHRNSKVLDFGVGWGRILRFFLKDVDDGNLFGVDIDPDILKVCEQTGMPGMLSKIDPSGPTNFDTESFDIIYAYSVFSHLPEATHLEWIKEFAKILKPGGVFIATTWPRRFIEFCLSLNKNESDYPHHPVLNEWYEALSKAFPEPDSAFSAYDAGKFVYVSTLNVPLYGDALISKRYIKQNWNKYLNLYKFVDDPNKCPQALIVAQKGRSNNMLCRIINELIQNYKS